MDSLPCSLAGSPRLSGQQAAQDGLTTLQPRQISTPLWTTTGCPGWTHYPAASSDLCTTPDNWVPKTDSLACSSTRPLHASPPTDYSGTQMPVAGRQCHISPHHMANRRTELARHRQPNTATHQHTSRIIHFPVHRLSPLLHRGVMWEHPHDSTSTFLCSVLHHTAQ